MKRLNNSGMWRNKKFNKDEKIPLSLHFAPVTLYVMFNKGGKPWILRLEKMYTAL